MSGNSIQFQLFCTSIFYHKITSEPEPPTPFAPANPSAACYPSLPQILHPNYTYRQEVNDAYAHSGGTFDFQFIFSRYFLDEILWHEKVKDLLMNGTRWILV